SKFQQTMILPDNVDKNKIAAHVEHGVLSVELPKLPVQSNDGVVKTIEVK
ncbi:MAG TPA: heat-shock protein, partial [Barnesiella intestinihominis]|nr:heat-shock protein [Barnesiella intestinihominis]